MNGNAAKLRLAFAARDAAKKAAGDLKKNPLTKNAGVICDQIEKAADFMGVARTATRSAATSRRTWTRPRMLRRHRQGDPDQDRARSMRSRRDQGGRQSDQPEALEGGGDDDQCRDLNQLIGNVPKQTEMGYYLGMDTAKAKAFFEDMKGYASKDCPFEENKPEDAKKALAAVAALAQRASVF
jgi:hypothetical protein